jgi:hypothetical protein
MGVANKLIGYAILIGIPAFIAAYVIIPEFRNQIIQLIMGHLMKYKCQNSYLF